MALPIMILNLILDDCLDSQARNAVTSSKPLNYIGLSKDGIEMELWFSVLYLIHQTVLYTEKYPSIFRQY